MFKTFHSEHFWYWQYSILCGFIIINSHWRVADVFIQYYSSDRPNVRQNWLWPKQNVKFSFLLLWFFFPYLALNLFYLNNFIIEIQEIYKNYKICNANIARKHQHFSQLDILYWRKQFENTTESKQNICKLLTK